MAYPSELASSWFRIRNRAIDFKGFEWMPVVLNTGAKRTLLYTCRQVGKTTVIALRGLIKCAANPYYSRLYVAPTQNHCGAYSKQKLGDLILTSPYFRKAYFGRGKTNQAYYKSFTNGSEYWLRWFATGVNSVRGLSVDGEDIDEVQLIQSDDIPVILECMNRSPYKDLTYAGTPLNNQNPIEDLKGHSSQNEWLPVCIHCNKHNYLDEKNIHPDYLCCRYCGKQLYSGNGKWYSMDRSKSALLQGFRVSSLMISTLPWSVKQGGEDSIIWKYDNYPTDQFKNEVLALPAGEAGAPVTAEELHACCDQDMPMCHSSTDHPELSRIQLFGGADWASDINTGKSYNVHCVGGFLNDGRFLVTYAKRYRGQESDKDKLLDDIARKQSDFRAPFIGADWGAGFDKCYDLAKLLAPMRGGVTMFQLQSQQKALIAPHVGGQLFQINRSLALSKLFHLLKNQKILFFRYEEAKTFLDDILNEYVFFDPASRTRRYDHPEKKPDDFLFALLFCYLSASMNRQQRLLDVM